jgi:ribonuclease P protein component
VEGSGCRLGRQYRLCSVDFAAVLKHGRALRGSGVSIHVRENLTNQSRLGLIVPKRILKLAVDRNRAKRVFREWFRHNRTRLTGKDCVIRVTAARCGEEKALSAIGELERVILIRGV